jgi:hypothetical protein
VADFVTQEEVAGTQAPLPRCHDLLMPSVTRNHCATHTHTHIHINNNTSTQYSSICFCTQHHTTPTQHGDRCATHTHTQHQHQHSIRTRTPTHPHRSATRVKARRILDGYIDQINNGVDFATLAKTESDCGSAQNGGDLGDVSGGQQRWW